MIHAILPRRTQLCRKTTGRGSTEHILATNIDTAFIVTAADSSFDAACLEQMLVMAHESGARPVVLLNKIDLCERPRRKALRTPHAWPATLWCSRPVRSPGEG